MTQGADKKDKVDQPKGFVTHEQEWLLTEDFVNKETRTTIVSDGAHRDENGCHYLGK